MLAPGLLVWLVACGSSTPDAPRKVIQRLNRAEYDNTLRDLFGIDLHPSRRFPADDFALGFDNQAQALSLSPLHLELYDQAADDVLDVLFAEGTVPPQRWAFEGEGDEVWADNGAVWDSTAWVLWTEGGLNATLWAPSAGDYTVTVDAFAMQAGSELAQMAIEVDGTELAVFDVEAAFDGQFGVAEPHGVRTALPQGRHTLRAVYLNELKQPPDLDRNLIVDRIRVEGPLDVAREPPPSQGLVLVCSPSDFAAERPDRAEAACAEEIVRSFGPRAWRRPITLAEFQAKMQLYGTARALGAGWQEAVRTVIKAFLVSPNFVYRVETGARPGAGFWLDGYEVASRLSYFLWSSMPDARLMELAATGALRNPDVLEVEARRMLADRRAEALVHQLAGQWLGIRRVGDATPDPGQFPAFDEGLRGSMKAELTALAGAVLLHDRSVLELLNTTESYLDPRLVAFYGLPADTPLAPAASEIPSRAGWFTRAGLLTALSHPTSTSPVLRGKWVLTNLLCDEPPPPPDGISFDLSDQEEDGADELSLRQQLERHREDPVCYGCHQVMDPIGLSMEGFDGIGAARTVDEAGRPLDLTGEIPGIGAFDGPAEMAALLVDDPRVPRCAAEKALTYALGRAPSEVELGEGGLLDAITEGFTQADYRFAELVVGIVRSEAFRKQGPESAAPGEGA